VKHDPKGQCAPISHVKCIVQRFVGVFGGASLAMNEADEAPLGKSQMILSGPRHIAAAFGQVGSEHRLEPGHLPTAGATDKPLGIYLALLGRRVEKFTPRIQVYDKVAAVYSLLMATEPALGAFLLPTLTHNRPPGSSHRGPVAPSGAPEEEWKGRLR